MVLVVGLMSGTSCDGVDAALVDIIEKEEESTNLEVTLVAYTEIPYEKDLKKRILAIARGDLVGIEEISVVSVMIAEAFASAARIVVEDVAKLNLEQDVLLVGSHGQTVFHAPQNKVTTQLGCPATIAARTNCWTVADFRTADVARGGQGAPVLPYIDYLLHSSSNESRLLLNIGGIANITVLPKGCAPKDVIAFDTGPGNMLMDIAMRHFSHGEEDMDDGGICASTGTVDAEALAWLLSLPYYSHSYPKSTGRELYNLTYFEELLRNFPELLESQPNCLATLLELTATTIVNSCEPFISKHNITQLRLSGGGAKNAHLLGTLQAKLKPSGCDVVTFDDVDSNSDAREALAFAALAYECVRGRPCNVITVTGASSPCILGAVYPPSIGSNLLQSIMDFKHT
eukprot:m.19212 g.19212  ORF g.19212 m.19212 type:complete len:401 (-) comp5082_c0_seq1:656-1858(-)